MLNSQFLYNVSHNEVCPVGLQVPSSLLWVSRESPLTENSWPETEATGISFLPLGISLFSKRCQLPSSCKDYASGSATQPFPKGNLGKISLKHFRLSPPSCRFTKHISIWKTPWSSIGKNLFNFNPALLNFIWPIWGPFPNHLLRDQGHQYSTKLLSSLGSLPAISFYDLLFYLWDIKRLIPIRLPFRNLPEYANRSR